MNSKKIISTDNDSKKNYPTPLVTICVVTFNQEKYVAQCLQSIIDQDVSFGYEIVVGDDCSTDGTQAVIQEFKENYPHLFRISFNHKNIGASLNYSKTHGLSRGMYVAHIDGDDLMLPGKLQKQVDTFCDYPNCVMVTHDMHIIDSNGSLNKRTFKRHKGGVNKKSDLFRTLPFFAHSSKMVKKEAHDKILPLIKRNTLDIEIHAALVEYGDIYHIDEPLGRYRANVGMSAAVKQSVNPMLIQSSERVFKTAIMKWPEQRNYLKQSFAKAMLNYAYQSAILRNKSDFNSLVGRSVAISIYSPLQILLYLLPSNLSIFLISIRNRIRYKV